MPPDEMAAFMTVLSSSANTSLLPATPLTSIVPIGSGGYATVYAASLAADCAAGRAGDAVALKVTAPASVWEFYVQRELHRRVPSPANRSFMPALALFVGSRVAAAALRPPRREALADKRGPEDSSGAAAVIVMPLGRHGTLLDLVNAHFGTSAVLGENLLLYLSLQLLQVCACPCGCLCWAVLLLWCRGEFSQIRPPQCRACDMRHV